jgi:hypothetical protein
VIFYYFCFFFSFLLGLKTGWRGLKFSFPLQRSSLSLSLSLSPTSVQRCRCRRSLAGLPLPGAASLAFGLLRPKPLPPLSLFLSLCPACSLTGRDRSSWRSASISVVGHPPLGHPSSAFCLRRIWRPVMYPSTLKKVLSGDAFSLSLCASHFPS